MRMIKPEGLYAKNPRFLRFKNTLIDHVLNGIRGVEGPKGGKIFWTNRETWAKYHMKKYPTDAVRQDLNYHYAYIQDSTRARLLKVYGIQCQSHGRRGTRFSDLDVPVNTSFHYDSIKQYVEWGLRENAGTFRCNWRTWAQVRQVELGRPVSIKRDRASWWKFRDRLCDHHRALGDTVVFMFTSVTFIRKRKCTAS